MTPTTKRLARTASAFSVCFLLSAGAAAQSSAKEKAAAEALFQEGKTLFDRGQYEQACNKFAASQQLDAGFGTLMNLGECYERRGMTASAWATFKEAAALARASGQTDREAAARDRAAALDGKLSKLIVMAGPGLASIPGAEVRLNGTPLPRAVWGSPVPVDPGPQRLEASAPGHQPWSTEVTVGAGPAESKLDVPALQPDPATQAAPPPAPPTEAPTSLPLGAPPPEDGKIQRTIGYGLAGVGAVGLVVGSIFGLRAFSKNGDSEDEDACRTEDLCSPRGLALREDARDAATVSTVAFIAGGALAASGLALVFTAPPSSESSASRLRFTSRVHPRTLALSMEGSW